MMLNIGKDIKNEEFVYMDASRSRAVMVCGKRGSGKSYTLGVIVEELLDSQDTLVLQRDFSQVIQVVQGVPAM
jgi:hypothetical protein